MSAIVENPSGDSESYDELVPKKMDIPTCGTFWQGNQIRKSQPPDERLSSFSPVLHHRLCLLKALCEQPFLLFSFLFFSHLQ